MVPLLSLRSPSKYFITEAQGFGRFLELFWAGHNPDNNNYHLTPTLLFKPHPIDCKMTILCFSTLGVMKQKRLLFAITMTQRPENPSAGVLPLVSVLSLAEESHVWIKYIFTFIFPTLGISFIHHLVS